MTNAERIVQFLSQRHGLWFDDDELSDALDIRPRQQVNQICRRLQGSGLTLRERRNGKTANCAAAGQPGLPTSAAASPPPPPPEIVQSLRRLRDALEACAIELRRLGLSAAEPILSEQLGRPDPRGILVMARTICEALVARGGVALEGGLQAAIDNLVRSRSPGADLLRTRLNTVRVLGNQAAHGRAPLTEEDALVGLNALLAALHAEAGAGATNL